MLVSILTFFYRYSYKYTYKYTCISTYKYIRLSFEEIPLFPFAHLVPKRVARRYGMARKGKGLVGGIVGGNVGFSISLYISIYELIVSILTSILTSIWGFTYVSTYNIWVFAYVLTYVYGVETGIFGEK